MKTDRAWLIGLTLPVAVMFLTFFAIPLARLFIMGGSGELGWSAYGAAFVEPRYWRSMVSTVPLSVVVPMATLFISGIAGVFLAHHEFVGRKVLTALLTLPLAFPGVVIGFMVIMWVFRSIVTGHSGLS